MKKILSFIFILLATNSRSQNIENPSFDSVYIGGIDRIFEWITSDAWPMFPGDTVQPLNPSDHYITSSLQYHELLYSVQLEYSAAFHGPFAIKLIADSGRVDIFGNPFRGFILNGNHFYTNADGYVDLKSGGTPFPYRPAKLRGHYQLVDSSPSLSNFPEVVILLKKFNTTLQQADTIGYAIANIQFAATSTWQPFEIPINYNNNQVPDSIVIAFFSPPLGNQSTFWVDSLGFEYNSPTSIPVTNSANDFLYYNPELNKIVFKSTEGIRSVCVYSVKGELLHTSKNPATVLDYEFPESGVYLIHATDKNNFVRTQKIIRKK